MVIMPFPGEEEEEKEVVVNVVYKTEDNEVLGREAIKWTRNEDRLC